MLKKTIELVMKHSVTVIGKHTKKFKQVEVTQLRKYSSRVRIVFVRKGSGGNVVFQKVPASIKKFRLVDDRGAKGIHKTWLLVMVTNMPQGSGDVAVRAWMPNGKELAVGAAYLKM